MPLLIAITAIPPLVKMLGSERFGILSLVWGLTAVAGAFDLGIGRAATRQLAEHIAHGRRDNLLPTARVAVRLALLSGVAGCAILMLAIGSGLYRWLSYSSALESEIVGAGLLLCLTIPMQASIAVYRGISEAWQQFRGISVIRMGLGASTFLFPLAVAQVTNDLRWLVGSLLASRILAWFAYRHLALNHVGVKDLSDVDARDSKSATTSLLRSGGWLTVSAVAGPLLGQADRFFVGSLAGVAEVPTYTIPFEVVSQLLLLVTAVSTVTLPTIAKTIVADPSAAWSMFQMWLWRIAVAMILVATGAALSLPYVLPLWVGSSLSAEAVQVGQILCVGLLTHSIGVMCFAFLHAAGRFRATAMINLAEIPFYFVALMWMVASFGATGAAIGWVMRVTVDAIALYFFSAREARIRMLSMTVSHRTPCQRNQ